MAAITAQLIPPEQPVTTRSFKVEVLFDIPVMGFSSTNVGVEGTHGIGYHRTNRVRGTGTNSQKWEIEVRNLPTNRKGTAILTIDSAALVQVARGSGVTANYPVHPVSVAVVYSTIVDEDDDPVAPPEFTGRFERIGYAEQFGVKEKLPKGIAYNPNTGKLYMVGVDGAMLYEIDIDSGIATPIPYIKVIGDRKLHLKGFNAGEYTPAGLTYNKDYTKLYMVGRTNNKIYEIDTDTGGATPIGALENFGIKNENGEVGKDIVPTGIAFIEDVLYMTALNNDVTHATRDPIGVLESTPLKASIDIKEDVTRTGGQLRIQLVARGAGSVADIIVSVGSYKLRDFEDNNPQVSGIGDYVEEQPIHFTTTGDGSLNNVNVVIDFVPAAEWIGRGGLYTVDLAEGINQGTAERITGEHPKLDFRGQIQLDEDDEIITETTVEFDANEKLPIGLANVGGELYMIGASNNLLYIIDDPAESFKATAIDGQVIELDVGENGPCYLAYREAIEATATEPEIPSVLYMTGTKNAALYTGVLTPVAATP